MKRKSISCLLLLCMTLGMFTTSCQDMLTPDSERHSYAVAQDSLYSYWGILRSLQNVAERYVILNECRADLVDGGAIVSDTIAAIINFGQKGTADKYEDGACTYLHVSDYYHVINSCNAYIAMCDTARQTSNGREYMIKEYSQVLSIRAWVYMQLVYAYGTVPFYTTPMLTTDDINNFMADPNHETVDAKTLADKLGPQLDEMVIVEEQYGLPEYYNYGDVNSSSSHFVCHSSKCMFPVNIVLGDLYLLKGDKASCEKAAQYYYNYINTKECGPLSKTNYYSSATIDPNEPNPFYTYSGNPFGEEGRSSSSTETITCIPSNNGKLEGKVMTDISRLCGFEPELYTSGGESATAAVGLNLKYEHQLNPSKGYIALCDAQDFEIYLGTTSGDAVKIESLEILPGVGDARRSWIYRRDGKMWDASYGDDRESCLMISKQNPGGSFSATYPVIYRKSTVWLRYAEALNRAGFPSYAFAILKTGLCDNDYWYPSAPSKVYKGIANEAFSFGYEPYFYAASDSIFAYYDTQLRKLLPEGWNTDNQMKSVEEVVAYMTDYYQKEADALNVDEDGNPLADDDPNRVEPRQVLAGAMCWAPASATSFYNQPLKDSDVACYYLDRREVEKAATVPYLNYNNQSYLRGRTNSYTVNWKENLLNGQTKTTSIASGSTTSYYTMGVHQRGCGFISWKDPSDKQSRYNYVDKVSAKIKEATGLELTAEDIYSGNYDAQVQDAVEDLIIDEMGLELAFEGSRFSDLARVAIRRNDPTYLAKRVAMRSGTRDAALENFLSTESNWYLPMPKQ